MRNLTISNPHAWAVGTVDEKTGAFKWRLLFGTRVRAKPWKFKGEVIRKVFIQPAEEVRRTR